MRKLWILFLVFAIPAACQQQGEQAGTTEETTAAVDAATVEQTIRSNGDRFEQAMVSGDAATLASFYADDAIVLPQGVPQSQGIDAIRTEFETMAAPEMRPTAFSLDPHTVVVSESGDLAYEVGTFSYTGPGPDGTEMTDNGKYVAIWAPNEAGEWKIAVDTWNSDAMPGAPAAEGEAEPTTVE